MANKKIMEHKHEHNHECKHEHHEEIKAEKFNSNKKQQKTVFIVISIIVLALLALLIFKFPPKNQKNLKPEEAKNKTEKFINDNLMMPGTKATISKIEEEYGLYKVSVDVGNGEIIDSYVDKKGSMFFPQAFEIDTYVNPYLSDLELSEEGTTSVEEIQTEIIE